MLELGGSPGAAALAAITARNGLPAPREVLLVQHGHETPSALLLDALVERGLAPVVRCVSRAGELPDIGAAHAAILVGSESAEEATAAGHLDAGVDWVRRADDVGVTILGIGCGARTLALAFGATVSPTERPLRGWGLVDTAVPHLIAAGPWLTWQHDVIRLPAATQILAHNRLGPQAFALGRHLGIQFHPEATPRKVAGWAARRAEAVDARALLEATTRDTTAAASCTHRLLSALIGTIS